MRFFSAVVGLAMLGLAAAQPGRRAGPNADAETTTDTAPRARPVPRGPAAGPNYIPTPEEAAAMEEADRIKCGACQFWSPTADACVSVPLKYDCQGDLGVPGLMGCGVECSYYEEDGEHGHCVDIDRDECTAIEVDQYDRDIAALVVRRDAGEIPAGELRLLPPLPPPVAQAAEEVAAPEVAAPAQP